MKNMKNIQAIGVAEGKKQHLDTGKVYEVTEEMAKVLISSNKAVEAKSNMKIGKVYTLPKKKSNLTD